MSIPADEGMAATVMPNGVASAGGFPDVIEDEVEIMLNANPGMGAAPFTDPIAGNTMTWNTRLAYQNKVKQFKAFCDYEYFVDVGDERYNVTEEKMFKWLIFVACKTCSTSRNKTIAAFDIAEYHEVRAKLASQGLDLGPTSSICISVVKTHFWAVQRLRARQDVGYDGPTVSVEALQSTRVNELLNFKRETNRFLFLDSK